MTEAQRRSAKNQKSTIKERIRLSNEAVKNGFSPDPWVVEFRRKNNISKLKWKEKDPKNGRYKYKPYGKKKASIIKNSKKPKLTEEERKERVRESSRKCAAKRKALGVIPWHKINKDRVNEYLRNKKKTNHSFRIACNLRKRLSYVLRLFSAKKSQQTLKLLGCSMPEFMIHLESKFQTGMSFDNYGQWHIDHKVPCALFDLTKPEQQAICFHYTNLQPLWAMDNLVKNKRINGKITLTI